MCLCVCVIFVVFPSEFSLHFHILSLCVCVWIIMRVPPALQPSLPSKKTTYNFTSFQLSDSALTHLWSPFNHFPPCCSDTPELRVPSPHSSGNTPLLLPLSHRLLFSESLLVLFITAYLLIHTWEFMVTPDCVFPASLSSQYVLSLAVTVFLLVPLLSISFPLCASPFSSL